MNSIEKQSLLIVLSRFRRLESLIITPLSGKIFFRNLKWTTKNDTINIFRGYLVVRHWLSTCRTNEEDGAGPENTPCRFGLYFEGFEWFIYNRTAVYSLIEQLFENERLASENEGSDGGTQVGPDTSVLGERLLAVNIPTFLQFLTTLPFCIIYSRRSLSRRTPHKGGKAGQGLFLPSFLTPGYCGSQGSCSHWQPRHANYSHRAIRVGIWCLPRRGVPFIGRLLSCSTRAFVDFGQDLDEA